MAQSNGADYNAYWEKMEQEWQNDAVELDIRKLAPLLSAFPVIIKTSKLVVVTGSKPKVKKSINEHVERLRVKRQQDKHSPGDVGRAIFPPSSFEGDLC